MTEKMTRTERVAAKVAAGLSNLDAEIVVEEELHAEKIERLKAAKAAEDEAVRAMVAGIVEELHPDIYAEALAEARARRSKKKSARNSRVRAARAVEAGGDTNEQTGEVSDHSIDTNGEHYDPLGLTA